MRDVIFGGYILSLALHIIRKYCLSTASAAVSRWQSVAEVVIISKVVDALCR